MIQQYALSSPVPTVKFRSVEKWSWLQLLLLPFFCSLFCQQDQTEILSLKGRQLICRRSILARLSGEKDSMTWKSQIQVGIEMTRAQTRGPLSSYVHIFRCMVHKPSLIALSPGSSLNSSS